MLTREFESLGRAAAADRGYADLPFVIVPHPFQTLPEAEIRAIADRTFPEIVARASVRAGPEDRTAAPSGAPSHG